MKKLLAIIGLAIVSVTNNVNAQAPAVNAAPVPQIVPGQSVPLAVNGVVKSFTVVPDGPNDFKLVSPETLALMLQRAAPVAPAAAPVAYQAPSQPQVVAAAPAPAPVQRATVASAPAAAPAPASGPSVAGVFGGLVKNAGSEAVNNGLEAEIEGRADVHGKKIGFGKGAMAGAAGGASKTIVSDGLGAIAPGLFDKGNIFTGKK